VSVVTICGSMRYFPEMLVAAKRLTEQGEIVLMPFVLKNAKGADETTHPLNELHKRKIDLSDSIFVVGQPGDSTEAEIAYARQRGKVVQWADERPAS
jgi:hypothetical protein